MEMREKGESTCGEEINQDGEGCDRKGKGKEERKKGKGKEREKVNSGLLHHPPL